MREEIGKIKENWPQIRTWIAPEKTENPSLRFINYFIEHGCNLRCLYCNVVNQTVPIMSDSDRWESFKRLRKVSGNNTILSIVGGEPTRQPEFLVRVISDAVRAGFYVNITTNGFGLSRSLIEELSRIRGSHQQYLRQIALSVDCEGPKSNLTKALGTLEIVKEQSILPVANTVIGNQTSIIEFKKHADEFINHRFFVVPQIISPEVAGGAFSAASLDEIPTKQQIRELMPYLIWKKLTTGQIAASFGYLWAVTKLLWSEDGRPDIWHCLPNFRDFHKRGRGHIAMDSDGFIGPCQEFPRQLDLLRIDPEELSIAFLDRQFRTVTQKCSGCFHNCYINEDELRGPRSAAGELSTALAMAKVVR